MDNIKKQKIDFYKACYYLCGLSGDAFMDWNSDEKTIKITDTLDAHVYRSLNYDDGLCAFDEAKFSITFIKKNKSEINIMLWNEEFKYIQNEENSWSVRFEFRFKKAKKIIDYFKNDYSYDMDYVLNCLYYLKPSDIYFANQHMPNLSLEDQKAVMKKGYEMLANSLELVHSKSKVTQKARKLVKKYN